MSENKKLSNCLYLLIKEDLRDFLNHKKRLEKGWYFFPYDDMSGKIRVIKDRGKGVIISSEIENLVRENARLNASRRREKHEKLWAEEIKRYKKRGITLKNKSFKLDEKEIWQEELEKEDYDEIVNLISQVKRASDDAKQRQRRERNEKLASNSQLFYWGGNGHINPLYLNKWKNEEYRYFEKNITEKELRTLKINSLHPVLNNFPFEKEGFYIIEGTENLPWESRPFSSVRDNFNKFVELNDKITITPYQVENDSEFPKNPEGQKGSCDTCHKKLSRDHGGSDNFYLIKRYHGKVNIGGPVIWVCRDCYPTKEQEYLQNYETVWEHYLDQNNEVEFHQIKFSFIDCYAGKKNQNGEVLQQQNCPHCQPWKQLKNSNPHESEKEVINYLIQYFQTNNIQRIELENGQLTITNNNNNNNKEIKTQTQINNDYKLEDIQNWLQKKGQKTLTYQELEKFNNSPISSSRSPKIDYTPYLIGGGIVLLIVIGVVSISYRLIRKVK